MEWKRWKVENDRIGTQQKKTLGQMPPAGVSILRDFGGEIVKRMEKRGFHFK